MDGVIAERDHLASKPAPDVFVEAARMLGVDPARSVAVEDAMSGVQSAAAGGFALVVGVDRGVGADALRDAGAHVVVDDLAALVRHPIRPRVRLRFRGALRMMDRDRFPVDPWRLVETSFDLDDVGVTETLFAVGNGYLGLRGNHPEGRYAHEHGTFINGFHETFPIRHAEQAYGFAEVGQTIVNAPDAKVMRVYVDDEPLSLDVADVREYERDARHARRRAAPAHPLGDAVRQGGAHRRRAPGVVRGEAPRDPAARGHGPQRRRAGHDQLPAASTGRTARTSTAARPTAPKKAGFDPRKAERIQRARAAAAGVLAGRRSAPRCRTG